MKRVAGMKRRTGERGAVKIKTILVMLILGVVVLILVQITPVYMEQRAITYEIDDLANKAAVRNSKPDDVKREIERIRKSHDLPEGSITYAGAQDSALISVSYNRNVNFFVTSYDWRVDHKANGKAL